MEKIILLVDTYLKELNDVSRFSRIFLSLAILKMMSTLRGKATAQRRPRMVTNQPFNYIECCTLPLSFLTTSPQSVYSTSTVVSSPNNSLAARQTVLVQRSNKTINRAY